MGYEGLRDRLSGAGNFLRGIRRGAGELVERHENRIVNAGRYVFGVGLLCVIAGAVIYNIKPPVPEALERYYYVKEEISRIGEESFRIREIIGYPEMIKAKEDSLRMLRAERDWFVGDLEIKRDENMYNEVIGEQRKMGDKVFYPGLGMMAVWYVAEFWGMGTRAGVRRRRRMERLGKGIDGER